MGQNESRDHQAEASPAVPKQAAENNIPLALQRFVVGCKVVRGPNWKWEEQDGGEGNVGTVVKVQNNEAWVIWDVGTHANYRCSPGEYDLRILDNAPAGVKWDNFTCAACGESPIVGILWKCFTCAKDLNKAYELCSFCYHSNMHNLSHKFIRWTDHQSAKVVVNERLPLVRYDARGLFPGAVVGRGRDWSYGDQDGGRGNTGVISKYADRSRGWVTVKWSKSKQSNGYRVGNNGKSELTCGKSGEVWCKYYPAHLPKLGAPEEANDNNSSDDNDQLIKLLALLLAARDAASKKQ